MARELDAHSVTLGDILKADQDLRSPLFQRTYVWGKDELDQLFQDIDAITSGEDDSRFLGALIFRIANEGGSIVPREVWIVDGQQRITSLYLVILSIALVAQRAALGEASRQIATQFLLGTMKIVSDHPKLRPTLSDRKQFNDIVSQLTTPIPVLPKPDYGLDSGKLKTAFAKIYSEVRVRLTAAPTEKSVNEFLATVLDKLRFVEIQLGDEQDPFAVFEALNTRGIRLEVIDLIRNDAMHRVGENVSVAQKVYETGWVPFEESFALPDTRSDYFFPFALIHESQTTKSKVFGFLHRRWEKMGSGGAGTLKIVKDLSSYVPAFNALAAGKLPPKSPPELQMPILALYRMKVVGSAYPFLMQVIFKAWKGDLDASEAANCLRVVDSFLVRRAFAGLEPTGLHAIFKGLWDETKGVTAKVIAAIDKSATIKFPTDEEFEQSVRTGDLYRRRLAPYVLREFEVGLTYGDVIAEVPDPSIDHIMPQTFNAKWASVISAEAHAKLVDTWANLVPMSQKGNSEKSGQAWSDIRAALRTEAAFKSTRQVADRFEEWNEAAIVKRGEELARWAVKRWPKVSINR